MDLELNLTTESVELASPLEPLSVAPETPIREVFECLKGEGRGSVVICRDGVLVGIFTERDALRLMARCLGNEGGNLDAAIETVMIRNPVTLAAEATVADAVEKMSAGGYRRLPIVDRQRKPVGVVQVSGIVHYLAEHFPKTIYNQPPMSNTVTQHREGP
ncbi:MAG TPA: CBS domain-containing protein [Pirellulales bacterium]|nr:CBS domain-containing protein [Pirellulales bacterium]